jgi:hypothetical protein
MQRPGQYGHRRLRGGTDVFAGSPQPRVSISQESIFRQRVKKGAETPISVVADKAAARGANPAHDRSFWRPAALAAGWHALVRLSGGTQR